MNPCSSRKAEGALYTTVYFIILTGAAFISICDLSILWARIPFFWFAAASLVLLAALVPRHFWRLKLGLFLVFATWLFWMPEFTWWSGATRLFLNGGMIHRGMTIETVKERMRGFYMEGNEHRLSFAPQFPSADWVFVDFENGRVRDVGMSPD